MKKLFIPLILILVLSTSVYSQNAIDTLSTSKYVYCQLFVTTVYEFPKGKIQIDFGQDNSFFPDARFKDEVKRKFKIYSSMVDALNYMAARGWELAQTYVIKEDKFYTYHWLLKKKIQ
jgi:hypothetical protein